jgi:flagellar basal-body rod protein FlgG
MFRSLWIAKTGLEAQQNQLDVITNNLANVGTTGFKRSRAVFEDLLYQTIRQPGGQSSQVTQLPSGLQLGTGVRVVAAERLYLQGNLQQTGNNKDLAIQGIGFFQILMPDGTLSYTRDGSFQVNSEGLVVTASGYPVQPTIAIPSDAQSVTVGRDGTVSVVQPGSVTPNIIGTIELASFMNPAGLSAQGENVFIETASSGPPIINPPDSNGMGYLAQGYIETSNVNVVEEMTNMIQAQRAYEINSKAVTAADQMLQKLAQM